MEGRTAPRATRGRGDRHGWFFLAPYVVLLVAFGLIPVLYTVYQSFVVENAATTGASIGIDNYPSVLTDFRFWPAVMHVGVFMLIWLPVMVFGVIMLALLLHDRASRGSGLLRLVYFLPGAVTGSAAVLLWYCMLQPDLSPFGPALDAMGLDTSAKVFQDDHLTIIFALMAFTTGVGQWIVIMYGALQNIPEEILEAAEIDGCGPIRRALFIKLPLITKYVLYMIILSFAAGVQIFIEPQLLGVITRNSSQWWSVNQLGYSYAFKTGDFGGAATVSLLLLVLCTVAALFLIFRTDFFATEVDE